MSQLGRKSHRTDQYLSSVWTFDDERTNDSLYRWYGTLPAGLPGRLLSLYASKPGSAVADPFSGAGNVLLAAQGIGVSAIGLDTNPLAVMLARARLTGMPEKDELDRSWKAALEKVNDSRFSGRAAASLDSVLASADFSYSKRWFREDSLRRLWSVAAAVCTIAAGESQSLLLVLLSSVVRDVANVDPRCTHHLVTKVKPYIDAAALLQARIDQLPSGSASPAREDFIEVHQGDALAWTPGRLFDLVVVHPPYLGVIHYNGIHRLATDVLGMLQREYAPASLAGLDFCHPELRAADMSTDNSARYGDFIERLADVLEKVTAQDGRVVVIIGDQRHKGLLRHPFTSYIAALEARGFALEENFIWVLQNNGGMHVLRRGHFIDHNYILVFAR